MKYDPDSNYKSLSIVALISFSISLAFCTFLISATILNKVNVEHLRIEQQMYERNHRLSDTITKLLYKTQSLSAIVIQSHGSTDSFNLIAPTLVDDPAIQNVLLAPDGIVTKVYPLYGNENLIGWDFFDAEGPGNKEAKAARDSRQLVLGGPIDIIQGGQAIFGRLPIFIDTPEQPYDFWGFVSVTLKLNEILERAEIDLFHSFGYAYELWRINPDTNEKQVIAGNYEHSKPRAHYIEKPVRILNAEWFLRVSPIQRWYHYAENIALIIAGFCISFLVFIVMQHNHDLKSMQKVFETMAITDPLTGIFNRRHFMEIVRISLEKSRRYNEDCFFIMFDIDRFKRVNDTYGHQIGDKVLMDVTARIKTDIRPYDIFARYGGEEFIIFATGITKSEVCDMVERLRLCLCTREYKYDDISFYSSASFGIARLDDYNLDKAIKHSDEALYMAKKNGRNCYVYYDGNS